MNQQELNHVNYMVNQNRGNNKNKKKEGLKKG
jgi:hypothetical protein